MVSIQLEVRESYSSMGISHDLYIVRDGKTIYIGTVLDNIEEFKSTLTYQINPRLRDPIRT